VSAVELDGGETNAIKEVTSEMGLIDGLAVDNDGVVYGASIGDNAICRMVDGEVETVIRDEEGLVIGNPTNVAVRSNTLYIANLGLWHVAVLELIVIIVDYFRIAPPPGAARTGKSLQ